MKYPYLQPFKNITVTMKGKTNNGVTNVSATEPFNKLKDDGRFHCVTLDNDGTGKLSIHTESKPIIGVLAESYNRIGVSHTVITQGIVPIKTSVVIHDDEIGKVVSVSETVGHNGQIEIAKANSKVLVGKVLGSCEKAGDYVPVLIGMY
ncbi:MAG: hypothetical protein ACRCX2_30155 [Paraclostridium sp.]